MTKSIPIDIDEPMIRLLASQAASVAIGNLTASSELLSSGQAPFDNEYVSEPFLRNQQNVNRFMGALRHEVKQYAKRHASGRNVSVRFGVPNLRDGSLSFTVYLSPPKITSLM